MPTGLLANHLMTACSGLLLTNISDGCSTSPMVMHSFGILFFIRVPGPASQELDRYEEPIKQHSLLSNASSLCDSKGVFTLVDFKIYLNNCIAGTNNPVKYGFAQSILFVNGQFSCSRLT